MITLRRCAQLIMFLLLLVSSYPNTAMAQVEHLFGGENTTIGEYPWFTAIQRTSDGRWRLVCSGALIGSRFVLTASHCVENARGTRVEVSYWCRIKGNCGRRSDVIGVRQLFRHQPEDGGTRGDLVLLELSRAVEFDVTPAIPFLGPSIHPNQKILKKGRRMMMVGAGRVGNKGSDISAVVKKVKVKYLPTEACKRRVDSPSLVTDNVVCSTVSTQDGGSPCAGDSGAAVVVDGERQWRGRDVILALHNRGPTDCSNAQEKQAFLHFRMEEAASLLQSVVCGGEFFEDWCSRFESIQASTPSMSPIASIPPTSIGSAPKLNVTLLHTFPGHKKNVYTVSFNANGSQLVSASLDQKLKIWNPLSGGGANATLKNKKPVRCARWNPLPDSRVVASGHFGGKITLWDVDHQRLVRLLKDHDRMVPSLAWHPNGVILASGSADESIRFWNTRSGNVIQTISTAPHRVFSVDFHPDGSQLGAGLEDGTILIWNMANIGASYNPIQVLEGHTGLVSAVAYSPGGQYCASASWDGTIKIWTVGSGLLRQTLSHKKDINGVAWSPNGKYLVSASDDKRVAVWDAQRGGKPLVELRKAHTDFVRDVDWSPDGVHIASASYDDTVKIWKVQTIAD